MTDPQLRLIQVEPALSRTAARAWQWIPIRAGQRSPLWRAGLARVLLEEKLVPAHGPDPAFDTRRSCARRRDSPTDAIRDLARTLVARRPALVIARDDNPAVAALNVVLGAVGDTRRHRAQIEERQHTTSDASRHSRKPAPS